MTTATKNQTSFISPDEAVRRVAKAHQVIVDEIHKVVVGQDELIELMLMALFTKGHVLAIGAPGLAKSLTVSALSTALHLNHSRIHFTQDLMPADVIGYEFLDHVGQDAARTLRFARGPIFAGLVLADEIDNAPPRTQAVLLQAMHDRQVTVGANTYALDSQFLVVATENPVGQRGRYPLSESQRDQFMFSLQVEPPSREQERQIVNATTRFGQAEVRPVLRSRDILWIQQLVRQVPATDHVVDYAVDVARATRPTDADAPEYVKRYVAIGASTRAAQQLILAAKARALMKQRCAACAADVRAVARAVLGHRITLRYDESGKNINVDRVLDNLIPAVPEPAYGEPTTPPSLIVVDPGPTPTRAQPENQDDHESKVAADLLPPTEDQTATSPD